MIIDLKIEQGDEGIIKTPLAPYQADERVKNRTAEVMNDFWYARQTMNGSYAEFNFESVLSAQDKAQRSFNAFVEPRSSDPDEEWKSNAYRPIVRNRIISIAAHICQVLIFPLIAAQNDKDEFDRMAAAVMRDLMEYVAEESDYARTFVYTVIAALVNPAAIVHTEFSKRMRTVKNMVGDGTKWEVKEVLDEIMSGFKDNIVPIDELFIADIYEEDIQKEPYLLRRRALEYDTAYAIYHGNELFDKYVKPGLQFLFDQQTRAFYQVYDENLKNRLVEEVIYYHRAKDLQLHFVNGILLDDPDQPNPRRDKLYPFAKTGYQTFAKKFFYYRSLSMHMAKDEEIINDLYRMVIDGTFLQLMPPINIFGDEEVNSSVTTPGTVNYFGESTKVEKIDVGNNLAAGMSAIEKVEASLSESSNDQLQSGQDNGGSKDTAFEISRLEKNSEIMTGQFSKMIGFLVKDLGRLKIGDILQFGTVADIEGILSGDERLKYQTYLLPDKTSNGRKVTRKISFDASLPMDSQTDDQMMKHSMDTFKKEGGKLNTESEIWRVNPTIFRNLKFKCYIRPDVVTPPSSIVKRALNLELYDRAIKNPAANQEAIYRDLLLGSYDETRDDADKYVAKPPAAGQPMANGQPAPGPAPTIAGQPVPQNPLASILGATSGAPGNKSLATSSNPLTNA